MPRAADFSCHVTMAVAMLRHAMPAAVRFDAAVAFFSRQKVFRQSLLLE